MSGTDLHDVILAELRPHGHMLSADELGEDLIGRGVNSAVLIQVLSALEDRFDVALETEVLFAGSVTVERIADQLTESGIARTTEKPDNAPGATGAPTNRKGHS